MDFDAIVVGSGISGGWAAKEFSEKGMKTLVIERGHHVEHQEDYVGEGLGPWEMKFRDKVDRKTADSEHEVQKLCYAFLDSTKHFFVNDKDHPYSHEEGKPFSWIRGYHLGGRSLTWHRQSYRLGDLDFEANKKDGHGVDWPIRYKDMKKWYDHVELFAGITGNNDGLSQLPDGKFQPPMEFNCVEKDIKVRMEELYEDRRLIIGRAAHLTEPTEEQLALGRGTCQNRNQCQRGCSFGAYFSSQSATLPAARNAGNLTVVTDSIVHSLVYDPETKKATGVRVIDSKTKETKIYSARVIFMCASTLGSTQILLNSTSETFQNGFANNSGALGHYLMDHLYNQGASGEFPGHDDKYYVGRRATGIYIPRFQNLRAQEENYYRGFGFQGSAQRRGWKDKLDDKGFGADFKESFNKPGPWTFSIDGFGEMLPDYKNHVSLHKTKIDQWGIPELHIDCAYGENDWTMRREIVGVSVKMLEDLGLKNVKGYLDEDTYPGLGIHEMGTARMGRDPKTSVLNSHNQCHDVDNVFITDGSSMTSSACQNPSLTYMALTARAVDYAVTQMKANNL
ncbi:MAG: GMC family oxidoreductase [Kordiimonadaceae bacterium]|jgi:choline dehydrogenase-like flavoprotein|nr:GMC family oxidoreductase [Kordiimonadaceae bacterium]MBT6330128.1 GMC family oxidoreductase [Kordiimonadaceae bacterium]